MDKQYIINYKGSDKKELDRFLSVVARSEGTEFHDPGWCVTADTLEKVYSELGRNNIYVKECVTAGAEMKFGLYDYQKKIVDFCLDKETAIIVAPCGSGKSPVLISLFMDLKRQGTISPKAKGLIVVKSSLKVQWKSEVEKFSDLKVNIVKTYADMVGNTLISKLKKKKAEYDKLLLSSNVPMRRIKAAQQEISDIQAEMDAKFISQFDDSYDLFIANYETLKDAEVSKALHKVGLEYMACDEVQYIKSDTAARSKAAFDFNTVRTRFGATATPIQKNPFDVYSISKFVRPEVFPSKQRFGERYVKFSTFNGVPRPTGSKNEVELNSRLSEYMVVISKEEVSDQLPKLTVVQRYCRLTPKQEKMTERLMKEIEALKEEEASLYRRFGGAVPADNPELIKIQGNIMARQTFAAELATCEELLSNSDSPMAKNYITKSKSSKIELLLSILEEIFDSGEKVAVFSKYTELQPILDREVQAAFEGVKIAHVTGSMSSEERHFEVYNKFRDNDEYKLLLMSNAAAEGFNLSHCRYLIELDVSDSYLIQTQRHGRLERADSIFDQVFVYQLIAENSYDTMIGLQSVEKKKGFDDKIIKGKTE